MCPDIQAEISTLTQKNVICSPVHEERWGSVITVTLPGGGRIGIYQPKHPVAHA